MGESKRRRGTGSLKGFLGTPSLTRFSSQKDEIQFQSSWRKNQGIFPDNIFICVDWSHHLVVFEGIFRLSKRNSKIEKNIWPQLPFLFFPQLWSQRFSSPSLPLSHWRINPNFWQWQQRKEKKEKIKIKSWFYWVRDLNTPYFRHESNPIAREPSRNSKDGRQFLLFWTESPSVCMKAYSFVPLSLSLFFQPNLPQFRKKSWMKARES